MFISKQLKQQNIAEYLIYMWQVEDLIRAYGCDLERIREELVPRFPAEQQGELAQWYEDLIEMMRREEVMQQGHLQITLISTDQILYLPHINQVFRNILLL